MINNVGPGGEFLTHPHTFKHFKQELYAPLMEERDNYDTWMSKGGLSIEQRASMQYKQILENYEVPEMDGGSRKDLDAYMASIRAN